MPPKECAINDQITLKLEKGQTRIYVNGKYFMHCLKLVLNIPRTDLEGIEEISSIDEFADVYQHRQFDGELTSDGELIAEEEVDWDFVSPEEEFVAHCSNLQAWVEHDYDTRLLKADLAFPLLKKLTDEGDEQARFRLKEEILKRYESGYKPVIEYLFVEGFFDYLDEEEQIYGLLNPQDAENLKTLQEELGELNVSFYFVPDLNYSSDKSFYGIIPNHRRFSSKNKAVTQIDLNGLNLTTIPITLTKFTKLRLLILTNQDINLNLEENKERIFKMKLLELIRIDRGLLEKINQSTINELERNGKKITSDYLKILEFINKSC